MRRLIGAVVVGLAGLTVPATPSGAIGQSLCVHFQTPTGIKERCGASEIPPGSEFAQPESCTYKEPTTAEPQVGDRRLFREHSLSFWPPTFASQDIVDWATWLVIQDRKYPQGFRVFDETCNEHFVRTFSVPLSDPIFDPTPLIEQLERSLVIPEVELLTVPDTSVWGGLVVNVHAFLGIRSASWVPLESPPGDFLGVPLKLVAIPRTLEFSVNGSAVPCVAAATNRPATGDMFPPEPPGFRDDKLDPPDDPLPTQPCVFTPRAPGDVTVTATVTFTIRAVYGPGVIVRPDFVRTSTFTVPVVELKVVNTRP